MAETSTIWSWWNTIWLTIVLHSDLRWTVVTPLSSSNQVGWLMHDLDDDDCTPEAEEQYKKWSALEETLRTRIFDILKQEDIDAFEKTVAENKGYYNAIKPFMLRNGFKDGRGWWVT